MSKKSFILEFSGPSGIGKSTVRRDLVYLLGSTNDYYDYHLNKKQKLWFLIKCFPIFLVIAFFLLRSNPKTFRGYRQSVHYFCYLHAKYTFLRKKPGVHIVDEGIFHKFRHVRRESKRSIGIDFLKQFVRRIETPDFLVILDNSFQNIAKNIEKRDKIYDKFNVVKSIKDNKNTYKDALYLQTVKKSFLFAKIYVGDDASKDVALTIFNQIKATKAF